MSKKEERKYFINFILQLMANVIIFVEAWIIITATFNINYRSLGSMLILVGCLIVGILIFSIYIKGFFAMVLATYAENHFNCKN